MKTSDFYYDLPQELIAQTPVEPRNSSRLMILHKDSGELEHRIFKDLPEYLRPGDCLILNDTRVIPARIYGVKEETGAVVEFLLLTQKENNVWECLCKPGKRAKVGTRFNFGEGKLYGTVIEIQEDGNRLVQFDCQGNIYAVLDQIGSAVLVQRYAARHPMLEQLNQRLGERSDTLRRRIALYIEKRIQYAYPAAARQEQTALRKGEKNFLSVSDLLWLFVIGAFLGDMVETVFCRVTAGVWMSRSSLVWGPFSVVWGLALVLATVLLRQEKDRSDRYLFAFGTVMGGVYEYVCSAVTELLFGTVFWDYSKFKFNLGGRINLLYCFFWGIAAVIWMRYGYPLVLRGMEKVRSRVRPWMTALLAVFMAANMLTSALALARYDARTSGDAPNGQLEVFLDEHFDNARMEHIYPNAKKVTKAE